MSKNKNSIITIGILIILVVGFGILYVYANNSYGVKISCDTNEIISFGKIAPQKFNIVDVTICEVDYEVKLNETTICKNKIGANKEIYVLECRNLKKYDGQTVQIIATFYTADGKELTTKTKEMTFTK